jgi:nucleotide-binding universal stress UspA family protein
MEDTMRIAYASDFSPASRAAFSMALRLTKSTGGQLTILHVLLSPASMFVTASYVTRETWDLIEAEQRASASQQMDALVKLLAAIFFPGEALSRERTARPHGASL